jgi:hypothetical protein
MPKIVKESERTLTRLYALSTCLVNIGVGVSVLMNQSPCSWLSLNQMWWLLKCCGVALLQLTVVMLPSCVRSIASSQLRTSALKSRSGCALQQRTRLISKSKPESYVQQTIRWASEPLPAIKTLPWPWPPSKKSLNGGNA